MSAIHIPSLTYVWCVGLCVLEIGMWLTLSCFSLVVILEPIELTDTQYSNWFLNTVKFRSCFINSLLISLLIWSLYINWNHQKQSLLRNEISWSWHARLCLAVTFDFLWCWVYCCQIFIWRLEVWLFLWLWKQRSSNTYDIENNGQTLKCNWNWLW